MNTNLESKFSPQDMINASAPSPGVNMYFWTDCNLFLGIMYQENFISEIRLRLKAVRNLIIKY